MLYFQYIMVFQWRCAYILANFASRYVTRARSLSLVRSKLRLCSVNHRPAYWSNLPCDWPSTTWAYSEPNTKNGPSPAMVNSMTWLWVEKQTCNTLSNLKSSLDYSLNFGYVLKTATIYETWLVSSPQQEATCCMHLQKQTKSPLNRLNKAIIYKPMLPFPGLCDGARYRSRSLKRNLANCPSCEHSGVRQKFKFDILKGARTSTYLHSEKLDKQTSMEIA